MTRETIKKTRIIFVAEQDKCFGIHEKVSKSVVAYGYDFYIRYEDDTLRCCEDANHPGALAFDYRDGTKFATFEEAKKFLQEHRTEIMEALKARFKHRNRYWDREKCEYVPSGKFKAALEKKKLQIRGTFKTYYDTFTHKVTYSETIAKNWCKNTFFFLRKHADFSLPIEDSSNCFLLATEEPESVLFEQYEIAWENNEAKGYAVPQFKLMKPVPVIRIYKDKFMRVVYNAHTHKYEDDKEIFVEDGVFTNYWRSWYGDDHTKFRDAYDLSCPIIEEGDSRVFSLATRMLLKKKLNAPQFVPESPTYYSSNADEVDSIYELSVALLKRRHPYSDNETKICKEVADFLQNIPFDEEHAVVKYKNGYILRFGAITQVFQREKINSRGEKSYEYRTRYSKEHKDKLVQEQYMEYARLFVNNTLSTRSLSLCQDGGKRWQHEGIHLVSNLFQSNPEITTLGIDVEERNRKALETLYTVHPKLKYMKKYMEKHPDVLYNSCVPFLRGLFQYNMILETFIALGKDSIFWTPIEDDHRYHYHGYRSSDCKYEGTVEVFSMDQFIDILQLTRIDQKGDFYQRLGLTRQQFKLIFDDVTKWADVAAIIFKIGFKYKNESGREVCIKRESSWQDPVLFKGVSYEEVRLVAEMAKALLAEGESSYWIGNKIERLYDAYGSLQRVYKAIIVKKYNTDLIQDYLNMRKQMIGFPDFKESIWDIFPDDNDDLLRSHNRIQFLVDIKNMYDNVMDSISYLFARTRTDSESAAIRSLYLYVKEHNLNITDLNELVDIADKIVDLTTLRNTTLITMRELIDHLPADEEELTQMKEQLLTRHKFFANLHYIYWERDTVYSYPSSYDTDQAKQRWGNRTYIEFLKDHLSVGLDVDKYDLYVRLRRKFLDNDNSFNSANYPLVIATADELEKLYNELAAKEPELNRIIEERERQRREQIQRENEEKVAGAQRKYVERYKKLKALNYSDDEERCIVVPKNLVALIIEGQTLHHCVGSFVDSVSEGKDTIVFLRKKSDVDQPYATINLLPNGKQWFIDQAHTESNGPITEEDVTFLKKWGEAKGIMQDSIRTTYGAKCHH